MLPTNGRTARRSLRGPQESTLMGIDVSDLHLNYCIFFPSKRRILFEQTSYIFTLALYLSFPLLGKPTEIWLLLLIKRIASNKLFKNADISKDLTQSNRQILKKKVIGSKEKWF